MREVLVPSLKESSMITMFVLIMMVVIEYFNIKSRNIWSEKLRQSPFTQILTAALLGITPGCLGTFAVVSLYTHRMIGFAALVTAMIATSGDEAFVMFALFPGKALLIHLALLMISIVAGIVVSFFTKSEPAAGVRGFKIHTEERCKCYDRSLVLPQLKKITFERGILLLLTLIFFMLLLSGIIGPVGWNWKRFTFLGGGIFLAFIFTTVPDHFLKEHFYKHIIKNHLLRIFLWTLGAFVALHFLESALNLGNLMQNNLAVVLILAVLIGIIPESGPHLIFVTLFSQNLIPFSILFANSIVQDGHGMLPLLAESRKDFIRVKLINMGVALIAGLILLLTGL